MTPTLASCARALVITLLALALFLHAWHAFAQPPAPDERPPDSTAGVELLTRGALHEAFADQVSADQDVVTGALAPTAPPEPIDELPPEVKPDGDDVEWIPGYWYWDDERHDFIWISGVWRKIPPGLRWVAGYWTEVDGQYRRVSGMWSNEAVSDLQYLPDPPESLEHGPVSPAPSATDCWVPGHWVYYDHGYRWRPGHWEPLRVDWVWMPARYIWTPSGCLYQRGYWDYPLAIRGQVYCPVYFDYQVYRQPHFCYRPSETIRTSSLLLHLFVRAGHCHYYFGDYYGNQYRNHYHPWYDFHHTGRRYDPLLTHVRSQSRHTGTDYVGRLRNWNHYFTSHAEHRPPPTIKLQHDFERRHKDFAQLKYIALGRSINEKLGEDDLAGRWQRNSAAQQEHIQRRLAEIREHADARREHDAHSSSKRKADATAQRGPALNNQGRGRSTTAEQAQLQRRLAEIREQANARREHDAHSSSRPKADTTTQHGRALDHEGTRESKESTRDRPSIPAHAATAARISAARDDTKLDTDRPRAASPRINRIEQSGVNRVPPSSDRASAGGNANQGNRQSTGRSAITAQGGGERARRSTQLTPLPKQAASGPSTPAPSGSARGSRPNHSTSQGNLPRIMSSADGRSRSTSDRAKPAPKVHGSVSRASSSRSPSSVRANSRTPQRGSAGSPGKRGGRSKPDK